MYSQKLTVSVLDSRDDAPMAHIQPAFDNGLWKCVHCMNCISRCPPKHLKPAQDISNLRKEATKLVLLTAKAFAMQLLSKTISTKLVA